MSDEKQESQSETKPQPSDTPAPDSNTAGMAQVGNQKVPRPNKVSDRSVLDDIDE